MRPNSTNGHATREAVLALLNPAAPPESIWNEDAEQSVLSAMLMEPEAIAEASKILTAKSFHDVRHGQIFQAMSALADDAVTVDPVTLSARLELMGALESSGGKDYIGFLVDIVPTAANVRHHAGIVADMAAKRETVRLASRVPEQLAHGARVEDVLVRLREQLDLIALPGRTASRFMLRDDEELSELPPTEWLIEGVVPDDAVVVVFGPSASLKTFLVLDWVFHVRTGLQWHGRRTSVGEVVYLCGEGANGITKRTAAWKALNNYTGKLGVHFLTNSLQLNEQAEVAGVIGAIETKGISPRLIVIDTLARFLTGDENTAKDIGAFIRSVDALRRRFSCTVVIVHHTGKDETKGGRGSNSLLCAADTEIRCERDEREMELTVSCTKMKDAPEFPPLTLEAVSIAHSLALKPSKPFSGKLAGKNLSCLLALSEHDDGNGLKHGEWLEHSGEKKGTFEKALRWLKHSAYVSLSKGRYSVNEAGRMALKSTQFTAGLPEVHSEAVRFVHSVGVYSTPGGNQTSVLDDIPDTEKLRGETPETGGSTLEAA